jgi:hypothetical protein
MADPKTYKIGPSFYLHFVNICLERLSSLGVYCVGRPNSLAEVRLTCISEGVPFIAPVLSAFMAPSGRLQARR